MVAIQEFLNDGEDVFGSYPNVSFLHDSYVFIVYILLITESSIQKKCQTRRSDILTYSVKWILLFYHHDNGILFLVVSAADGIAFLDFVSKDNFSQGIFYMCLDSAL